MNWKKMLQCVIVCDSLAFTLDSLKYGLWENRYVAKNVVEAMGGDFRKQVLASKWFQTVWDLKEKPRKGLLSDDNY